MFLLLCNSARENFNMSINNVVIFGSTGTTGLATVAKAIEKGLKVTAFLRDPSKLPGDLSVSRVVEGDVTIPNDVDEAVKGQDAVIIALGTRNDLSASTVMSDGTRNIIESMAKHGVKRVSCCLSSFLFWEEEKIPPRMGNVHADHKRMLDILKQSDREWVVVCPPHIDENPGPKEYRLLKEERVGPVISKYDLGDALVKCLLTDEYLRCRVGLGY